jgi:hypothetical protein
VWGWAFNREKMSVGGAHRGTGVAVVVAPNPPRTAVLRRPEQTKRDKGEERKAAGCFDWLSFVLMRRETMGGAWRSLGHRSAQRRGRKGGRGWAVSRAGVDEGCSRRHAAWAGVRRRWASFGAVMCELREGERRERERMPLTGGSRREI